MADYIQLKLIPEDRVVPEQCQVALALLPPNDDLEGDDPAGDFVATVRQYGVLEPIVITRAKDGSYRVADGKRRAKAARQVGLEEIPAAIFPAGWTPEDVINLILNLKRRSNIFSELASIERLLDKMASEREIIAATKLSPSTIRARLRLRNLNPLLRQAVIDGKMSTGAAEDAAELSDETQAKVVRALSERGRVTRKDVMSARSAKAAEVAALLPDSLFETPGVDDSGSPERFIPTEGDEPGIRELISEYVVHLAASEGERVTIAFLLEKAAELAQDLDDVKLQAFVDRALNYAQQ